MIFKIIPKSKVYETVGSKRDRNVRMMAVRTLIDEYNHHTLKHAKAAILVRRTYAFKKMAPGSLIYAAIKNDDGSGLLSRWFVESMGPDPDYGGILIELKSDGVPFREWKKRK